MSPVSEIASILNLPLNWTIKLRYFYPKPYFFGFERILAIQVIESFGLRRIPMFDSTKPDLVLFSFLGTEEEVKNLIHELTTHMNSHFGFPKEISLSYEYKPN